MWRGCHFCIYELTSVRVLGVWLLEGGENIVKQSILGLWVWPLRGDIEHTRSLGMAPKVGY